MIVALVRLVVEELSLAIVSGPTEVPRAPNILAAFILVLCQQDFDTSITVMPAQAGIQKSRPVALDSRFRGNDAATAYPSTSH